MSKDFRLTTHDNPFDPFDQFTQWLLFDKAKGYNTCELMDRLSDFRDDMTEKEVDEEHERVINSIITNDPLNIYKKVERNTEVTPIGG